MATIKRTKASLRNGKSQNGRRNNGSSNTRDTESLWAQYRRSRSDATRNRLVERYRGIVESMALAMAGRLPSSVDVQDLKHAGMWGLMQAIENFQPERGIQFLSFMRIRVRGAMLDELRNMDFLPRLVRSRRRALDAAAAQLRQTLRRDPTDAELAEALGVSESNLWRRFSPAPPSDLVGQRLRDLRLEGDAADALDELVDDQLESPVEALNRQELLEKIRETLQPIEWKVLRLHYLEGMSGKDVARRLRLSASRICQIHGRVLSKLKTRLKSLS